LLNYRYRSIPIGKKNSLGLEIDLHYTYAKGLLKYDYHVPDLRKNLVSEDDGR